MKKTVTRYYILCLLAVLFAAPGIAAYVFYHHPSWLGSSSINKGVLLTNPFVLPSLNKNAKWRIVYWHSGVCDNQCLKQVDILARVRLALGRKLYNVEQVLAVDQGSEVSAETRTLLSERDFNLVQLSPQEQEQLSASLPDAQIYITNPDNYVILSYTSPVNPDDIYKDLKLLLNTSEHQNG